jgi:pyruvate,water dikinase
MKSTVKTFNELSPSEWVQAGGKGGTLVRLYQAGFPVPDGIVVLPGAFSGDELRSDSWFTIQAHLAKLHQSDNHIPLAVRSSALVEDSAQASFAGEFETVLNCRTDEEVFQAIHEVHASKMSERVQIYSREQGFDSNHQIAVIVQHMVDSELAGVLFSADPILGDHRLMVGNFIHGLGDRLVSGEASGQAFKFERPDGNYTGPQALKPYAEDLYNLAIRLERELGTPQDIEWAIADDQIYLLQSRPITTLLKEDPTNGEWNASLGGDFLWSNVNFGEAVTSVMTPFSWTVLRYILKDWMNFSGYHPVGNICGRPYLNISLIATALYTIGKTRADLLTSFESTLYMNLSDEVEIPQLPLSRLERLSALPGLARTQLRQQRGFRKLSAYLNSNPTWCHDICTRIQASDSTEGLLDMWSQEINPHVLESVWIVLGSATIAADSAMQLLRYLTALVGADDAYTLVSSLSTHSSLDQGQDLLLSLGPLAGLSKVARGELDRSEYLARYGHRGPDEFELSIPRPAEDHSWLDEQLAQFRDSPIDVDVMLEKQRLAFEAAWGRLERTHPAEVKKLQRRIDQVASLSHQREMARSEYVRDRWVVRTFAVQAGELTGLEYDIFFLTLQEVLDLLAGDESAVVYIPVRKRTHAHFSALPPYPSIIRGRFDPFRWQADPHRRSDYYDASGQVEAGEPLADRSKLITGAPGSAGHVEGLVRLLKFAEQGVNLQEGEILVTTQTDIAWTLLFPRAAAIVTDVGAPLSHAAIVARELGIPAVVGCGDATMRLKTGDRVRVDGGQGVVEILSSSD